MKFNLYGLLFFLSFFLGNEALADGPATRQRHSKQCHSITSRSAAFFPATEFDPEGRYSKHFQVIGRFLNTNDVKSFEQMHTHLKELFTGLSEDPRESPFFTQYVNKMIGPSDDVEALFNSPEGLIFLKSRILFYQTLRQMSNQVILEEVRINPGQIQVYENASPTTDDHFNFATALVVAKKQGHGGTGQLGIQGPRIAFDSGVYIRKKDMNGVGNNLFPHLNEWLNDYFGSYKHLLIPRIGAESGTRFIRLQPHLHHMVSAFSVLLSPQEMRELNDLSAQISEYRKNVYPNSESDIIADDVIMAQVLMSGTQYFFTRDMRLFNCMQHRKNGRAQMRFRATLGGYDFEGADLSIPSPQFPGRRYRLQMVNVYKPVDMLIEESKIQR